jgi:outer membrane usher protein
LSDFSIEAGYLRTGYGTDADDYGDALAASASYRRGISDSLTLEGHLEYGDDLRLGGIGAVWSPDARFGVLNASFARSSGLGGGGDQRAVGYQWRDRRFGVDLQVQRFGRGFRDLGELAREDRIVLDPDLDPDVDFAFDTSRLRAQDRASLWMAVPRGSLGYSWVRAERHDAARDERIQSLTWSSGWGPLFSYLSVNHSRGGGTGLGLSLHLPLGGNRSATLSASHANGRNDVVAGLRQVPDYAGGWGWDLQAGRRADAAFGQAAASVRGDLGEATLGVDRVAGSTGAFGQAAGSLVWMGGGLFASRPISDAFAVVSTNGVAGVPVLYENRELGLTDADGLLLVPDLRGWQRNRIAIDPDGLGAGYRLPPLEQFATPADNGAVLVPFDVARIHPALVTLLDASGAPVAAGSDGRVAGSDRRFLVGLEGVAWLEDHAVGETLELETGAGTCRYRLPATATAGDEGNAVRLGPLPCLPPESGS